MSDEPDKPDWKQSTRRHLVYWSIGALILVAICVVAVVAGLRSRRTEPRAIFTIRKMVPAASGNTFYIEHDVELVGDNLTAGIAKQSGSSVVECVRYVKEAGSAGLLGFRFVPVTSYKASGMAALGLGDCPQSEMIETPLRIELKPGQRYVVETCRDKSGAKLELYLHCDDL